MNNLLISYDLFAPGQTYDKVATAIKSLGVWAKVQYSFWYVRSPHSAAQAAEIVRRAQDANDSLIVVNASNNDACWYNLDPNVSAFLKEQWHRQVAAARY